MDVLLDHQVGRNRSPMNVIKYYKLGDVNTSLVVVIAWLANALCHA